MSTKLVDNYTFAQLKDFAKEKKIPRRTVMKTQNDLADLLVRHGYTNVDVKQYLERNSPDGNVGRISKKRATSIIKKDDVKTIDDRVINPDTGRLIKVGGKVYSDLVAAGKL